MCSFVGREYKVPFSSDLEKLEETVTSLMKEGWQVWGDLQIQYYHGTHYYHQVMVR